MRQNFLVLKGVIQAIMNSQTHSFPIKIVIPQGYPFHPPKVYLDMSIPMSMLNSKTYLGSQNSIKMPYLTSWSFQNSQKKPSLTDMMGFLTAVITSDPPIDQGFKAAMMGGGLPSQQTAIPQPQQLGQQFNPYQQQPQYGGNMYQQPQQNYSLQPPPMPSLTTQVKPADLDSYSYEILTRIDNIANDYVEGA